MRNYIKRNITQEELKTSIERFIHEHGREPRHQDFNTCPYLPTARTIQRRFGGLPQLRQALGLKTIEYGKGDMRRKTARKANKRATEYEQAIFTQLYERYHDSEGERYTVRRAGPYQKFPTQGERWSETRSDIEMYDNERGHYEFFDMFFPSDEYSFVGCVGLKRRKLEKAPVVVDDTATYRVTFVCMNPKITQEMIDSRNINSGGHRVVSYDTFVAEWLS